MHDDKGHPLYCNGYKCLMSHTQQGTRGTWRYQLVVYNDNPRCQQVRGLDIGHVDMSFRLRAPSLVSACQIRYIAIIWRCYPLKWENII